MLSALTTGDPSDASDGDWLYGFLYNSQLTNTLPTELGQLTALKSVLNVAWNDIEGLFPTQLAKLTAMNYRLTLGSNTNLYGTLPSEMGAFTKFTAAFEISSTKLNGSLPTQLGRWSEMRTSFNLVGNDHTSSVPTQLGLWSVMTSGIRLSANSLDGTIPSEFGEMTGFTGGQYSWQAFWLHGNSLTGAIPTELGRLSEAEGYFHLNSNKLCSEIPTELTILSDSWSTYPSADPTYWDVLTDTFVGPTPCPAVSALVALYEDTGGNSDGWTVDTNWMGNDVTGDSKDPCDNSWYGVTCSSAGEVTALNLRSQGLINELPSEIGFLTALLSSNAFDVGVNQLTGQLPSEMGEWTGNSRLSTFYIDQWFDLN